MLYSSMLSILSSRSFLRGSSLALLLAGSTFVSCGGKSRSNQPANTGGEGGSDSGTTGNMAEAGGRDSKGSGGADDTQGSGGYDDGSGEGGAPPNLWEQSTAPPLDTRPAAPAWEPPFEVGEPGWQDSVEPFCDSLQDMISAQEVWADERGVFVFVSSDCNILANGQTCAATGSSIHRNTGSGWEQVFYTPATGGYELNGIAHGSLLLIAGGLVEFELDGRTKVSSLPGVLHTSVRAKDVYALSQTVSEYEDEYALYLRSDEQREWKLIRELDDGVLGMFATEEGVLATMHNQVVFIADDGSLTEIPDTPAGFYQDIWGQSEHDFYVAQAPNRIMQHYDGEWSVAHEVGWVDGGHAPEDIRLWGTEDKLFYASANEFGMIDAEGEVQVIVDLEDDGLEGLQFEDLWGRSEDEVFLTYSASSLNEYACGGLGLLWYDGDELHRF